MTTPPPADAAAPSAAPSSAQRAFAAAVMALLRLYHPRLAMWRRDGEPLAAAAAGDAQTATIVVANHPNGLIDPLVLRAALGRPLAFLAKAPLFANPIGRFAMAAFEAVPVARRAEAGPVADEARNDATFARCRAHLARGGWLALFPEGISHDLPGLQPLRTGAARIALGALAQQPGLRLQVLPVGLLYGAKDVFRSEVAVAVGAPIDVAAFVAATGAPGADGAGGSAAEDPALVRALTARIDADLRALVVEAESQAMLHGLLQVAALIDLGDGDPGVPLDSRDELAARQRRALRLAEAWRRLREQDPPEAARLFEACASWLQMADELGLGGDGDPRAPLAIERGGSVGGAVGAALRLAVTAPVAALGVASHAPTWFGLRWLARKLARGEQDVVSTWKLLGGMVLYPATWLLQALGLVAAGHGLWGLGWLLAGPLLAAVTLRWLERAQVRRVALRAGWLRLFHARVAFALAARRRELALDLQTALRRVSAPDPGAARGSAAEPS